MVSSRRLGEDVAAEAGDRTRLAATFGTVAALYDRARPGYPAALLDDLAELTGPPGRLLEIGPGTGQATRDLVARGHRVLALEPGAELAGLLGRALAAAVPDGRLRVVEQAFEPWAGGPGQDRSGEFDVVFAATSWHWLDPEVAYREAARLLRPGGCLAIVATGHVSPEPGGDPFFTDAQAAYERAGLGDGADGPGPPEAVTPPDVAAIAASGCFEPAVVRRHVAAHDYTAAEYLDVLRTYSGHIAAAPARRDQLFADLRALIEARPHRTVRKHYLHTLQVARRAPAAARMG